MNYIINGLPKISSDGIELAERARLALEVAAAGKHNIFFFGPPGCGKSLLLMKLRELLPPLTEEEAESVNRIKDLAGHLSRNSSEEWFEPPFRMPHMSASIEGMCGGGSECRPGEISLAHNGVLFLDEAAEFKSGVLQLLRVPLENGKIVLSRAGRSTTYPANFQLAMAANPCPCGNFGSDKKICLCSLRSIDLYWKRLGDPLLSRMDIMVDFGKADGKFDFSLEDMKARITRAVEIQRNRGVYNARLMPNEMEQIIAADDDALNLLDRITEERDWSPRRKNSVVKVARTIADLQGVERVEDSHISMAASLVDKTPLESL